MISKRRRQPHSTSWPTLSTSRKFMARVLSRCCRSLRSTVKPASTSMKSSNKHSQQSKCWQLVETCRLRSKSSSSTISLSISGSCRRARCRISPKQRSIKALQLQCLSGLVGSEPWSPRSCQASKVREIPVRSLNSSSLRATGKG